MHHIARGLREYGLRSKILNFLACGYSAPPERGNGDYCFCTPSLTGLGRSSVQSRDSETRRLAICIAGGRASSNNLAFLPRQHNGSVTGSLTLAEYPGEIVRLSLTGRRSRQPIASLA